VDETRVELAFRALELFGLSGIEQANVFGIDIKDESELDAIKKMLVARCKDSNISECLDRIVDIGTWAGDLYHKDPDVIEAWANDPDKELGGLSPKQSLLSADCDMIGRLYAQVGGLVGAK
jgi:hypothetical protein